MLRRRRSESRGLDYCVTLLQELTYTFVPAAMHTLQRVWSERNERIR
jgi:hypothetical protein